MENRRIYTPEEIYPSCMKCARERYSAIMRMHADRFGEKPELRCFSVSGRTEICGNHTDHQHGHAVGGAIHLDLIAAVSPRSDGRINVCSAGYSDCAVDIGNLTARKGEKGSSQALIRGVCSGLCENGYAVGGFDAITESLIPGGSGLSSSAAFEIMICEILSALYNNGSLPLMLEAIISQRAENVYFGKPCGLLDQISCAFGGLSYIDFENPAAPRVERLPLDIGGAGYVLCITNTHSSHGDLTADYAAVPNEMNKLAELMGKKHLRELRENDFYASIASLRGKCSDRALLRGIHFFGEENRVGRLRESSLRSSITEYISIVNESGNSSYKYLQNIYSPAHPESQSISLALALSERLLGGDGATRVHGGGFAGTIQAVVPFSRLDSYIEGMNTFFGNDACVPIYIRNVPSCEVAL